MPRLISSAIQLHLHNIPLHLLLILFHLLLSLVDWFLPYLVYVLVKQDAPLESVIVSNVFREILRDPERLIVESQLSCVL